MNSPSCLQYMQHFCRKDCYITVYKRLQSCSHKVSMSSIINVRLQLRWLSLNIALSFNTNPKSNPNPAKLKTYLKHAMQPPPYVQPWSHQVHACRTCETHNKISYVSLCAQLLSIFWRSYNEFAANAQSTDSTLGIYRVHTQRVHCIHAKIRRIKAHPGCLKESLEKKSALRKCRLSFLMHSLAQKHCKSERFMLIPYCRRHVLTAAHWQIWSAQIANMNVSVFAHIFSLPI